MRFPSWSRSFAESLTDQPCCLGVVFLLPFVSWSKTLLDGVHVPWSWGGPSSGLVPWRKEMASGFHWFYLNKCQHQNAYLDWGAGSGDKEPRRGMNRLGGWGLAAALRRAVEPCKVRLSFLYETVDWLPFNLVLHFDQVPVGGADDSIYCQGFLLHGLRPFCLHATIGQLPSGWEKLLELVAAKRPHLSNFL